MFTEENEKKTKKQQVCAENWNDACNKKLV